MDRELDKEYIIVQRFVPMDREKTLTENYYALDKAAKEFSVLRLLGVAKEESGGRWKLSLSKRWGMDQKSISSYEMKYSYCDLCQDRRKWGDWNRACHAVSLHRGGI